MQRWRPVADPAMLVARAGLNRRIRDFFHQRGVLEVETPLLGAATGSDPALEPIPASYDASPGAVSRTLYLQTSPEFAMKRLLAAGSGPIYQLGKAFRNGESGRRHNPEFTMLEWYRPGFSLDALMDEVQALVTAVLGPTDCRRLSYRELFLEVLDLDPLGIDDSELQQRTLGSLELSDTAPDRDTCLELLYSHLIEPELHAATLIHDYPPSQAALAKIGTDAQGRAVARRFELVIGGMEIANGYDELLDADEQRRRFAADCRLRRARALPEYARDERLLGALESGLPDCAGVALGVDRLLMLLTGSDTIDSVLGFPIDRA